MKLEVIWVNAALCAIVKLVASACKPSKLKRQKNQVTVQRDNKLKRR